MTTKRSFSSLPLLERGGLTIGKGPAPCRHSSPKYRADRGTDASPIRVIFIGGAENRTQAKFAESPLPEGGCIGLGGRPLSPGTAGVDGVVPALLGGPGKPLEEPDRLPEVGVLGVVIDDHDAAG